MKKNPFIKLFKNKSAQTAFKSFFWFSMGVILGLFFFISFTFIVFQKIYYHKIFPGVMINGIFFSGKTKDDVKEYFSQKNETIAKTQFIFKLANVEINTTAGELTFGYDAELLAQQAFSIGRSPDMLSNVSLLLQAYINGINLSPSYRFSEKTLETILTPIINRIYKEPVNALFTFQNGKVIAFKPSSDGEELNFEAVKNELLTKTLTVVSSKPPQTIFVLLKTKTLKPAITTDQVNNLGISEEIGSGTSLFQGSILNRVHNVTLASNRINGILIAPNEKFSFNKALGDISAFTGYKQAYVISNGKTVLGDGGGVCQVSTTLFRAALAAGLPITERHAHAYRVHYYEEDSPPGIDATVYSPTVDLTFVNDTANYILIQSSIDPDYERLTFVLYGKKDGRSVSLSKPVIVSQSPTPEPLYQDDPTLAKGTVKQIDFAAGGASVYFTREVVKNGKKIISEKYSSHYAPWRAVYLRGTKES